MTKKNKSVAFKKITVTVPKNTPKQPNFGGQALRTVGGLAGRYLGGLAGLGTSGSSLGTAAGAALSKWMGWGDYTLKRNSLIRGNAGQIPGMHSNNQTTIVRHKEYIGEVRTHPTVAGQINSQYFYINPGMEASYPWLAAMASNYQEYRIKGMVYEYVSTSGDGLSSTNTALGSVIMATQYRANASAFTSKLQILQEYFSSEGRPSENLCHPIECDPKENPFNVQYIRSGPVTTGEDLAIYDLGTFSIHTHGGQAANIIVGELWCTYEVELKKPQYATLRNPLSNYYHGYNATPNVDATHPFGTTSSLPAFLGLEKGTFTPVLSGTTITFPLGVSGFYYIAYTVRGASTATVPPVLANTTNCTFPNGFLSESSSVLNSGSNTLTTMFISQIVNVVDSSINAVVTFSGGTYPTSITFMDLYIMQLNDYGQSAP